jgi:hypothetical protein
MATCAPFHEQLLDFVYGVCDEGEAQALRAHLEVCPACQQALTEAQGQRLLFGRAALAVGAEAVPVFHRPAEPAPALDTVPAILPLAALPVAARRAPRYRRWLACAAAAAVLLAAGALWHLYGVGRASLENAIADHRHSLHDAEVQLAALKPGFEAEAQQLDHKLRAEAPLHLYVMAPTQLQSGGGEVVQVATRDLDGKPVHAKLSVTLRDVDTDQVLAQHETAAFDGMVSVPLGESLATVLQKRSSVRLVAEAQAGQAKAQVQHKLQVAAPAYVAHLVTNKTVYRPGDLLFFRALVLDRAGLTPPVGPIALRFSLIDAAGRAVGVVEAQAGPGGIAVGELAVTDKWADGNYELRVVAEQPALASVQPHMRKLQIARDVSFDLQADRDLYKPGDTVNMLVPRTLAQAAKGKRATAAALSKIDVTVDGQRVVPLLNAAPMAGAGGGGISGPMPPGAFGPGNFGGNFAGNVGGGFARNEQTNLQFNLPKTLEHNRARITIKLLDGKDGKVQETFEQDIAVVPSKLGIDFFPEGGELIAGVPNRVCYRVRSPRGESVNPEGRVIVLSGSDVLFDSAPGEGTGSFTFTPKVGESYSARITSPGGATTEFADPFGRMGGVHEDGLVLHAPQPVAAEGAPLQVVLRNPGMPKRVLLVAECRGKCVAQHWVEAKGAETSAALGTLAGVRGLVRLTAYEAGAGALTPLAERLVYRTPIQRLDLSALHLGGVIARAGQKSVHLEVRARDQNGTPTPAWIVALVIDERFRTREPSLLAHFFIAGDIRSGADLDDAVLLAADTPEARHALDLFLGTVGWRRFEGGSGKLAPAAGGFVALENASFLALQKNHAERVEEALIPARLALQPRYAALSADRQSAQAALDRAVGELQEYAAQPQQYLRIGLGVATLLLLAIAVGMMAVGGWRLLRRRHATPLFAGTVACLGLCLVSMLVLAALDPPTASWNDGRIATLSVDDGFRLPGWVNPELPFHPVPAGPPVGLFADATLRRQAIEGEEQKNASEKLALRAQQSLAELPDAKAVATANSYRGLADKKGAKGKTVIPQAMPPNLAMRFTKAEAENRRALGVLGKGQAQTQQLSPTPGAGGPGNVGLAADKARQMKDEQMRRNYSFEYVAGLEHDTLLWNPALFLATGSAQVAFDVPASAGTYRVLLLGNTPDGRLGSYEGRLEVQAEPAR